MDSEIELIQILSAIGIHIIPILALQFQLELFGKRYVGGAYQHEEYRRLLSLVINAGYSLSQFRESIRRSSKEEEGYRKTDKN